ncbi:uncharacterized protein [Littorina saxatilis]|uniref:uncharacterized protein n=1 Tax=Littorina saxatilis TaxID=31220 RepID=UPI0038B636C8
MERSTVQAVAFLAAECVSGLLSIACNLLVLLAIYRERSLQTVANCFIGSLALADFLVGLVIPPIYILIYLDIPNSYYGCVSMSCIALVMTDISLLNMSAIAVERFLAISRPYLYIKHITMRSAITSLLVICAAAILIGFFPLLMLLLPSKHGHVAINATYCPIQALPQKYLVYINFFSFYLPLMIFNFVAYTYILMTVKKHIRNIHLRKMTASRDTFFLSEDQANTKRKEKRGAKRTILILIVLIVCVVPLKLSDCFMYFGHMELPCDLYLAFLVLSHTKSFINPYLYALTSSKFAREVARIMPCIKVSSSPEINFLRRRFSRKGRKGSLQGYWLFPFELDDLIFEDESTQSRIYGESSMAEYNEMGNSFVPVGNSPSCTSDLDIVEWMQSSIGSYLHHDSNSFTSVRTFNASSFAERRQRTNDSSISCTQDTPDNKIRDSSQSITELLTAEHSHDLVAAQSSRGGSMVDPLTLQSPQPDMFPDEVNGKASLPHTKPMKRSESEQQSHHQSQVYKPTQVKPPLTSARPTGNVHEDGTKRKFGTSHEHLTHIKITALAHLFHKKSFVKRSGDDLDQDANILGHSPKPPSASSVQKGPSLHYECPVTYDCSAYGSHVHFDAAVTEQRKKLISGVSEGKSKTGGRSAAEERKEDSGSNGLIANVLPKDAKKEKSTGQKPSVAFHSGVSHSLNFRQDDSRDKGTLRRTPARGAHGSLDSERITFRSRSVSILQTIMTGLKKLSMVGRTQQSMECKSLGSSLSTVAEESAHTKQAQHKQSCEESTIFQIVHRESL